jgi:hypothetical protein
LKETKTTRKKSSLPIRQDKPDTGAAAAAVVKAAVAAEPAAGNVVVIISWRAGKTGAKEGQSSKAPKFCLVSFDIPVHQQSHHQQEEGRPCIRQEGLPHRRQSWSCSSGRWRSWRQTKRSMMQKCSRQQVFCCLLPPWLWSLDFLEKIRASGCDDYRK